VPISYLTPGIYVEEVPAGSRPIEALGTSVAAFLGVAPKSNARVHEAVAVDSFEEFKRIYVLDDEGEIPPGVETTDLAQAVAGFFANLGGRCYVVNLGAGGNLAGTGSARRQGIRLLEDRDEVAIVAAPGYTSAVDYEIVLSHCELMRDRVAVLDSPLTVEDSDLLKEAATASVAKAADDAPAAKPARAGMRAAQSDGGFGAYYYPWVTVPNAVHPARGLVNAPPSGHVSGVYARTDRLRGVHKAPANEVVMGAVNVAYQVTNIEQGGLNQRSVNVIRMFSGERPRIWGARTLADASSEWRYVNVRRTFCMIEESIARGTRWVVFEPNDQLLWRRIRANVSAFLRRLWRDGALVGRTEEEAFFVKCDEETNPPEVIDAGQVIAVIGVAVVKPAEFVIFRIGHHAAGVEKTE